LDHWTERPVATEPAQRHFLGPSAVAGQSGDTSTEAAEKAWALFVSDVVPQHAWSHLSAWFRDNGGLDSLASSIRLRSRAPFAVWLVKNGRIAPSELGGRPVPMLQRLFTVAGLPVLDIAMSSAQDVPPSHERPIAEPARGQRSPHQSRLAKRDLALGLLDEFKRSLDRMISCHGDVEGLVQQTIEHLRTVQGSFADRPHLRKSLAQIVTAVRRARRPDVAVQVLQWAAEHKLTDEYLTTELIQCHVAAGDLSRACSVLDAARQQGHATDVVFAVVIAAHARAHNYFVAQQVFEIALEDGIAADSCLTALVDAYTKSDRMNDARDVFDRARTTHVRSAGASTALIDAYGKAGDIRQARQIFDQARSDGIACEAAYTAIIDAYAKTGDLDTARHLFDLAADEGVMSCHSVTALLHAHAVAGDLRMARRIFDEAHARRLVNSVVYAALIDALSKDGDIEDARELFEQALVEHHVSAAAYAALIGGYLRAGQGQRAQQLVEIGRRAGMIDAATQATVRASSRADTTR
jgi:pentatricopeptide repeat protein